MFRNRLTVERRRLSYIELIEQKGPHSRRNIIRDIIREYPNRKEKTIDNDLKALVKTGRIILDKVKLAKSKPAYVYSVPSSSAQAVAKTIQGVLDSIAHIVDSPTMGKTGQFYVRDLTLEVIRAGQNRYSSIPTRTKRNSKGEQRLGYIPLLLGETADFTASYTIRKRKPFRLLYQIRNRFAEVSLADIFILVCQALRNIMQPVLIANRIGEEARTFCEAYGIVYYELRRQLLPSAVRAKAKKLVNAYPENILNDSFQFVTQQPFRLRRGKPIDPRSLHDVEVMSEPDWIEKPRRIWMSRQEELKFIYADFTAKPSESENT